MVNWKSRRLGDFLSLLNIIAAVILLNMLAGYFFYRFDLTEEKRYSIKDQTKELLASLEEDVFVEVYLEGELNAPFRRLRRSVAETLEEFRIYSGNKVKYTFTDPGLAMGQKARNEFMSDLAARGIQPTNVVDKKDGQRVEKIIFPGAIVSYGGFETGVMLLKGSKAASSEQYLNQSVEGVEFELANAIYKLANTERKRIGYVRGHGEADSLEVASFRRYAGEFYDISPADLSSAQSTSRFNTLIVAKPVTPFTTLEKFNLDQYIMRGGSVLFLVDKLDARMDSASRDDYFARPIDANLDDLLFRYGVRINPDLIQDQQSALQPVITGQVGGKPQMQLLEWPFFPLISTYPDHPITRNLDAVALKFASSIDTVKATGIKKTAIMTTSRYSRVVSAPVHVNANNLRQIDPADFTIAHIPVAYLLEGKFQSLFKNRFLPAGADSANFRADGERARIMVVADGDLVRNEINLRTLQPQELGFDPFTNYTFANRDFLMNALAYLAEEDGLIQARTKEVKIRPLDKDKVAVGRIKWQIVNIALPLLILIAYGVVRSIVRKRKYARF